MVSMLGRSPRRPSGRPSRRASPQPAPAPGRADLRIEGRRGSYGVKAAQRADKALRGEAEVEQHQCKDAAQRTAQCKGRAHLVQPFPPPVPASRAFFFSSTGASSTGATSGAAGAVPASSTGCAGRFLLRRLHRSHLVAVVQEHERQAHAVVIVRRRRAGRGCGRFLVVALAEELHRRGRMGLRRLIFCKHISGIGTVGFSGAASGSFSASGSLQ